MVWVLERREEVNSPSSVFTAFAPAEVRFDISLFFPSFPFFRHFYSRKKAQSLSSQNKPRLPKNQLNLRNRKKEAGIIEFSSSGWRGFQPYVMFWCNSTRKTGKILALARFYLPGWSLPACLVAAAPTSRFPSQRHPPSPDLILAPFTATTYGKVISSDQVLFAHPIWPPSYSHTAVAAAAAAAAFIEYEYQINAMMWANGPFIWDICWMIGKATLLNNFTAKIK